jgi:type IV secretory pathway TrbD component
LLNRIKHWFSLERPVLGGGVDRQIVLFTGVVAGTIGQWLFDAASHNWNFVWAGLFLGLIASFVTFPVIYYNAGLDKTEVTFVKWCAAFQNGFFWPALLEQVGRGFHS